MRFSRSGTSRAALLAVAVVFASVVTTAGAHAQVTQPQAPPGTAGVGICKDIDLHIYFVCATPDFICIGGNGDCNLRLNRLGANDFAVAVNFRFIAAVGGREPEVRLGQFVFREGEASSLVRYRLAAPVSRAEVQLLAPSGGTVLHRERVTIGTG